MYKTASAIADTVLYKLAYYPEQYPQAQAEPEQQLAWMQQPQGGPDATTKLMAGGVGGALGAAGGAARHYSKGGKAVDLKRGLRGIGDSLKNPAGGPFDVKKMRGKWGRGRGMIGTGIGAALGVGAAHLLGGGQ